MTQRSLFSLMIIALLLAACAGPVPAETVVVTENPNVPTPSPSQPTAYPGPIEVTIIPITPMYPAPGTPVAITPVFPPSGYEPQPGDANLTRDKVFLDLANSKILVQESYPVQVTVSLKGSLSDPCHQLRVVITPADASNKINLEVYSLFQSGVACVTVIQPFDATIPLGSYSGGHYSVYVNGQLLGEFDG